MSQILLFHFLINKWKQSNLMTMFKKINISNIIM